MNIEFYEKERDVTEIYACKAKNVFCLPHFHQSIELLYVLEGSFNLVVDSKNYTPQKDEIVFIPPFLTHKISDANSVSITVAIANEYLDFYHSFVGDKTFPVILDNKEINRKIMKRYFLSMSSEHKKNNPLLLLGESFALLGEIYNYYPLTPVTKNKDQNIVIEVINYISKNFKSQLKLEQLASHFHYSKFYFSKIFSKNFNCTFNCYLNSIRVQYVVSKITDKQKSLTELVFESGFNSLSTFYRHFNYVFGESPNEYLKKLNN